MELALTSLFFQPSRYLRWLRLVTVHVRYFGLVGTLNFDILADLVLEQSVKLFFVTLSEQGFLFDLIDLVLEKATSCRIIFG